MAAPTRLEYDRLPGLAPAYLRAATSLSGDWGDKREIAPITAHLPGLAVPADNLARYCQLCGFIDTQSLPVTYPHVLAFPLHMAVLTHKNFPLRLLGLIHIRNEITQRRAIAAREALDVTVSVAGHRDTARGIEFDLVTRVRDVSDEPIWQESATMLARRADGSQSKHRHAKQAPDLDFEPQHETLWAVPGDIGRRYAGVAGDYNPIHLSPWTAKLFGFPRAIATGMWTKARAAAELMPQLTQSNYTLAVDFKKPVFLPSSSQFFYILDATGAKFALTHRKEDVVHLLGGVRYL